MVQHMASLPDSASEPKKAGISNLAQRLITVAIFLPVVLGLTLIGGWGFTFLALALGLIGVLEFYLMAHGHPTQGSAWVGAPAAILVMLAFHISEDRLWIAALVGCTVAAFILEWARHPSDFARALAQTAMTAAGVLYVAFPAGFLIGLRSAEDGLLWILLILGLTWGTDTFAYIGGRLWGRHALAPAISPKKTVEGALVGWIGGAVVGLIILALGQRLAPGLAAVAIIAPWAAVIGDLIESGMKRLFRVKDSHVPGLDIFPGHGGVLDRIDGLILVALAIYLALVVIGLGA
ncbi:MAG: phosphatidate cytidylyltransferase [Phototrophicales bacterium]|nr:MAG: phosphatidate cytidylyltransferase [Phototrophicales bacterium]